MLGVGVSVTQLAVRGRLAIILGTGPVLAPLAVGDNITARVTWGTYSPTAPAVSINAPTVKEYRVNGAALWTTFGSYVVAEGDVIDIREIVTDNTGRQVTFPASRTVPILAPANPVAPAITGSAREGQTLTRSIGTWTGLAPITYETQWQSSPDEIAWSNIDGAEGATYVPTTADVGNRLRVRVTATNGGGSTPVFSAATGTVLAAGASQLFAAVIDGDRIIITGLGLELDGDTIRLI